MKKLCIILGILGFTIGMYLIMSYQIMIDVPYDIEDTKYEFFYRIGYMQNNGNNLLLPFTIFVPSILLAIGIPIKVSDINENNS